MYSRVMEDQSRLLKFVSKESSRAIRKATKALVKWVANEVFCRLAVGAAETISRPRW